MMLAMIFDTSTHASKSSTSKTAIVANCDFWIEQRSSFLYVGFVPIISPHPFAFIFFSILAHSFVLLKILTIELVDRKLNLRNDILHCDAKDFDLEFIHQRVIIIDCFILCSLVVVNLLHFISTFFFLLSHCQKFQRIILI